MSDEKAPAVRVNWLILVLGLGGILGFTGLMIFGFGLDPRAIDTKVMEEQVAPNFTLQTLDGETVKLADLRGKPVVINFWSTWCVPCRQEHPVLQKAPDLYPEVTFVGIVYQDDARKAKAYLKRDPVKYDQLMDPDGKVSIAYGVTGVPETYFVNPEGRIVKKFARPIHEGDLASVLEPMLR